MEQPIFDDWVVRNETAYGSRRRTYQIILALFLLFCVTFLILSLFYWYCILAFAVWSLVIVTIYLEWLKVKNHHLRILEDKICIVDRFGRQKIYPAECRSCTVVLKRPAYRSGGIRLLFLDQNKRKICMYEDMINHGSYDGVPPTAWEQAIMALPMTVVDKGYLLKNRN